ncbi:MAG: malto-oligosyltrehalose synthase [Ignavibacteriales bacterium]
MHIPDSTYRLQFNSSFGFNDAREIIDYLAGLGIKDIYASPILKAVKGSMHGYDVVDPNQLNPELGTTDDFDQLIQECRSYNMGWLQDVVPNHMAYSSENQMIVDLLENGPNSRFYNFFDIEWNHPHASVRQRILAPFLGKFFQDVLEGGELILRYDSEGFYVNYYDNRFPMKMESYVDILSFRLNALTNKLGKNHPDVIKYLAVLYILRSLPPAEEMDERYSQIKFVKGMLYELYTGNEDIKVFIDESLKIYNGRKDVPESFNLLEKLLSEQHFRLAFWKVANEEINYRRFFNISGLISLRMENEDVFNRIHSLILNLVKDGQVNGLRIDHVDGLYDPTSYLKKLRDRIPDQYLVVEKILELREDLPTEWPVEGTTGYEFTNYVNGIFCKSANEKEFNSIYQKFTKLNTPYERIVAEKKRLIIQTRMAGEVERLAFLVEAVSSSDRYGIDITMHGLKRALEEIFTYFPIYRTYINKDYYTERDRKYLEEIFHKVSRANPRLINEYNYIFNLLMLRFREHFTEEQKDKALDFVMKFQQLTGPLMAKGFEDTALYVYNRLISLNEVGGNAGRFGIPVEEFHEFNLKRSLQWPHTLNTTSTHDTKRGEDVRARINVLSELPDEWESRIKTWSKLNNHLKKELHGEIVPDKNDEYFLYQTLIGSFPNTEEDYAIYAARIKEYMVKAVREAKVHTAWIKPDEEYESAYMEFIEKILVFSDENGFLKDFIPFQKKIAHYGALNSISQVLVKMTSPGVPDLYQGTELWDLSLVDPDNRRPVDFSLRRKYLKGIQEHSENDTLKYIRDISSQLSDGRIKMFTIFQALRARNEWKDLFCQGEYIPLQVSGNNKENIVSYARRNGQDRAVVVIPRFMTGLVKEGDLPVGNELWSETFIEMPADGVRSWNNVITNQIIINKEKLSVGEILKNFPAGLLLGSENS